MCVSLFSSRGMRNRPSPYRTAPAISSKNPAGLRKLRHVKKALFGGHRVPHASRNPADGPEGSEMSTACCPSIRRLSPPSESRGVGAVALCRVPRAPTLRRVTDKSGEQRRHDLVMHDGKLLRSEQNEQHGQANGGRQRQCKPAAGGEQAFQKRHGNLGGKESRRGWHMKSPGMAALPCRGPETSQAVHSFSALKNKVLHHPRHVLGTHPFWFSFNMLSLHRSIWS